jgi:cardiolipin synthase
VGSANWDVRSLRLNFEFGLEVWDRDFAAKLDSIIDGKLAESRKLRRLELESTTRLVRMRNAAARLLLPYL